MIQKNAAKYLAQSKWVVKLLATPVHLGEFRERPTPRLIIGLFLMGFSYVLGWPAVAAFGFLAAYFKEPLIAVIGPVSYGLSYLVFIAGAWLSRAPHYLGLLARYAAQSLLMKILSRR